MEVGSARSGTSVMRRIGSLGSFGGSEDESVGFDRRGPPLTSGRRSASSGSLNGFELETLRSPLSTGGREKVTKMTKVEFVYADGGKKEVFLCGSWNDWKPIPMLMESVDLWSIVVVVPCGYQEFCYLVDGAYAVSSRHPVTADSACNWRTIHGPPPRRKKTLSDRFSESVNAVMKSLDVIDFIKSRNLLKPASVIDEEKLPGEVSGGQSGKVRHALGPLKYFAAGMMLYMALYFILYRMYRSVGGGAEESS